MTSPLAPPTKPGLPPKLLSVEELGNLRLTPASPGNLNAQLIDAVKRGDTETVLRLFQQHTTAPTPHTTNQALREANFHRIRSFEEVDTMPEQLYQHAMQCTRISHFLGNKLREPSFLKRPVSR